MEANPCDSVKASSDCLENIESWVVLRMCTINFMSKSSLPQNAKAMGILRNEFSWSKSRNETLQSCPRRYWFHYYGSWGGWDWQSDPRTREIYVLKQLHNRFAWIGVQVHKVLEELLHHLRKSKSLPNYQSIAENLQNRLRQDYRDSRDAKYRLRPKRFIGLVEHEYQLPVNDEEWRALATQAQTCVENFYRLPLLNQLKDLDYSKWLELEELFYFKIDGCKIWVSLDACYRSDDQIVLLDWKTGKSHEADHSLQMGIYAMYTSEKWGIQPDLILLKEVFLATGKTREYNSKSLDLEGVQNYVKESIQQMQTLLSRPEQNHAEESNFSFTDDTTQCAQCNFRKVCPKWHAGDSE